ncbi:hypothetical protein AAEP93_007089 [Penicillium crustosum]
MPIISYINIPWVFSVQGEGEKSDGPSQPQTRRRRGRGKRLLVFEVVKPRTVDIALTRQADLQPVVTCNLLSKRAAHAKNILTIQTVILKAPAAQQYPEHVAFPPGDQGHDGEDTVRSRQPQFLKLILPIVLIGFLAYSDITVPQFPREDSRQGCIRQAKIVTLAVPAYIPRWAFATNPQPPNRYIYQACQWIGWAAFAVHVISIGMAALYTQIVLVVVILVSTVLTAHRVGYEDS